MYDQKNINLQKNYNLNQSGYQLKLPLNIETIIPEDDSVRLLSQFMEAMDLTDLYSTYERINSVSPRTLLKIVFFLDRVPCYQIRQLRSTLRPLPTHAMQDAFVGSIWIFLCILSIEPDKDCRCRPFPLWLNTDWQSAGNRWSYKTE